MVGGGIDYNNFIIDFLYGDDNVVKTIVNNSQILSSKYYDFGFGYKFNYKNFILGGYIGDFNTHSILKINNTNTDLKQSEIYLCGILGFKLIDYENQHLCDIYTKISKNSFGIYLTLKCL